MKQRWTPLFMLPALAAGACGGSSDEDTGAAGDTTADGDASDEAGEENVALIIIDGTAVEFDAEAHVVGRCDPNFRRLLDGRRCG